LGKGAGRESRGRLNSTRRGGKAGTIKKGTEKIPNQVGSHKLEERDSPRGYMEKKNLVVKRKKECLGKKKSVSSITARLQKTGELWARG